MRRNFLLVARYLLKFTCCSLIVVKSLITRCKIRSLLVAKSHSLLIAKSHYLLVAEVACCKKSLNRCRNSLVTCCKIRPLLIAEVARCKENICCSLRNSFVTRCRSCSLKKITRYSLQNSLITRCRSCLLLKKHSSFAAKFPCYLFQKITRYS